MLRVLARLEEGYSGSFEVSIQWVLGVRVFTKKGRKGPMVFRSGPFLALEVFKLEASIQQGLEDGMKGLA